MTCLVSEKLVICRPHVDAWERFFTRCPCCRRRRLVLGEFQDYYGTRCVCLTCGREWMGGEPLEPTKPRRRREALAKAKQRIKAYVEAGIPPGMKAFRERLERELAQRAV